MNLKKAMKQAGILNEFLAKATPEMPTPVLYAWIKKHPALTSFTIEWPYDIRDIRRKLKCPAKAGGKRPPPKGPRIEVRNGRFFI